jgi:CMP-N-acetylneuraminic acid synthetase
MEYTIRACIESRIFDKVYVATDSREYADLAVKAGACVPFLEPPEMAGDTVGSSVPLLYFYNKLIQKGMAECKYLWCMQPSSPLRTSGDIKRACQIISSSPECDFLVSTTLIDPHYFHWALEKRDDNFSSLYFGENMLVDRSLLKPVVFRPNGAIKVARPEALIKQGNFFGPSLMTMDMPENRSVHVRTAFDFNLCEYILEREPENFWLN